MDWRIWGLEIEGELRLALEELRREVDWDQAARQDSPPTVGPPPGGTRDGWLRHSQLSLLGDHLLGGPRPLGRLLGQPVARALLREQPLPTRPAPPPVPATPDLWLLMTELARELHDRRPTLCRRLVELCWDRLADDPGEARLRVEATRLFLDAVLASGAHSDLRRARPVAAGLERRGRLRDAGYARTAAGLAGYFQGDLAGGLGQLGAALGHLTAVGDPVGIVLVENSMAGLRWQSGEIQRAGEHLSRALRVAGFWRLDRRRAALLGNMANLEAEIGRIDRAEELLQEAIRLNHRLALAHQAASSLLNLAPIYWSTGRPGAARRCLEEASRLGLDQSDPRLHQTLLIGQLALDLQLGRLRPAEEVAHRLRSSLDRFPDPWTSARLEAELGRLLLEQGRPEQALTHLKQARRFLSGKEGRHDRWSVLHRTARTLLALGRGREARKILRRSIQELEGMRGLLSSEHWKIPYLEQRREPYLLMIQLLVQQGRGEKTARESHALSQQMKARVLRERMLTGHRGLAATVDPFLLRKEGKLEARLRRLQERHEQEPLDPKVASRLHRARVDHQRLIEEISIQSPGEAQEAGLVEPPDAEAVLQVLRRPGVALVEYLCGDQESYAWMFRSGRVRSYHLSVGREQLEPALQELEMVLANPTSQERLGDLRPGLLHQLYQWLLAPLEPDLQGVDSLVFATDPPLHRLPFAALLTEPIDELRTEKPPSQAEFLIRRRTVEQTPSSSILTLPRRRADTAGPALPFLALADPAYPEGADQLPRLPHSRREAEELAALLPQGRIYTGAEATPEAYREWAPRARWIHLAAHGRCGISDSMHLGVALSPSATSPDGFLRTYEIARIPLQAELVVLSCCESALGEARAGEGLLGLARGFFLAGADRVLVTLWPVVDQAARWLMLDFYRGLVEGMDTGAALRQAQLRSMGQEIVMDGARMHMGHPFFWAPYALVTRAVR